MPYCYLPPCVFMGWRQTLEVEKRVPTHCHSGCQNPETIEHAQTWMCAFLTQASQFTLFKCCPGHLIWPISSDLSTTSHVCLFNFDCFLSSLWQAGSSHQGFWINVECLVVVSDCLPFPSMGTIPVSLSIYKQKILEISMISYWSLVNAHAPLSCLTAPWSGWILFFVLFLFCVIL